MKFWQIIIALVVTIVLAAAVRGQAGAPAIQELNTNYWKDDGPLELSPERGRFALVYSVVEDNSVHFSVDVARFATPDLGYINGKFVSLFAPGVSYLVMPGYMLGKYLGASQVGTFAVISVFALLNFFLVSAVARQLNAGRAASMLGALLFLFGTPAFAYAVTLYQHHVTAFLLLSSIYLLLKFKEAIWPLLLVWFICALAIVVDYPNLFLFFPVGAVALTRMFNFVHKDKKVIFSANLKALPTIIMVVFPLAFFLWFNQQSYGDPMQLSGTVQSIQNLGENGEVQYMTDGTEEQQAGPEENKTSVSFFDTRHMLEGLNTLLFSQDRGTFIFTPIILFGFLGFYFAYKKYPSEVALLFAVCAVNLILYAMWGDPYGGWAFGARYMIPSFAMLAVGCGYLFHHTRKNFLFFIMLIPIIVYSLAVNSLGALASNKIPPKIEVLALEALSGKQERYSFDRAYEFIKSDDSNSFVFNIFANQYMTALEYYYTVAGTLSVVAIFLLTKIFFIDSRKNAN